MQSEPMFGTVEIQVDELERLAHPAAKGVAMHEGGTRGGVATVVVERKLEDSLQVRAVLAVVRLKACELCMYEGRSLAGVECPQQGDERTFPSLRRREARVARLRRAEASDVINDGV